MEGEAVLYVCDPEKNTACRKTSCSFVLTKAEGGCCDATFRREFAREYSDGTPMVHKKWTSARKRAFEARRKEKCTET